MKEELPNGHGLSARLRGTKLIRMQGAKPSLTDAQHSALEHGIGRGRSLLLVAPTSSGKTDVGLYAATTWLEAGDQISRRVAYLVSHRALARQKYLELRDPAMLQTLQVSAEELVLATGDEVIDGTGEVTQDPLDGVFVVATYEKFLALLAGSGLRQDMSHYCVIADEIQLVADETRGQDIEILLTLIKTAKYGQFVGLSAVLHKRDCEYLAGWLGANLVRLTEREVPLTLELRTKEATHVTTFGGSGSVEQKAASNTIETFDILNELVKKPKLNCPIAVFCMTKGRVEDLARGWAAQMGAKASQAVGPQFALFDEASALTSDLLVFVDNQFGIHTADLLETERALIEDRLDQDKLAIVFATTTLAQGLNYSFQTVLFDKWFRRNYDRQVDVPISKADFHNMAGRAGRLGRSAGKSGRAIFTAHGPAYARGAFPYLTSDTEPMLTGRIDPARFDQLSLQIVAAGIVDTDEGLFDFLGQTLSAHIARHNNRALDDAWKHSLTKALANLRTWGFVQI